MKKILALALACSLGFQAQADPHDCISQAQAEQLIAKLKTQKYLVDYCDCCDEVAGEYDNNPDAVGAQLVEMINFVIVPCDYDSERVSVKIIGNVIGYSGVHKGKYHDTYSTASPMGLPPFEENASLNYQFYLGKGGKALQLGNLLGNYPDKVEGGTNSCTGLQGFPPPQELYNEEYEAWLKQKRK